MAINLLRMAVRITSVAHLKDIQAERMASTKERSLYTFTRNVPKRVDELLDGGSIYWVIKRLIRVRQEIVGIQSAVNDEGRKYCLIKLNPLHILLEPREQKPFQGWRYLKFEESPLDLPKAPLAYKETDMPSEMMAELKELGLL